MAGPPDHFHVDPVYISTHQSLVLPVLSLAAYPAAYITRLTKTSMLDVLGQDYVRTARAKGVAQVKVLFVHTLRNSLIPVVTYVGPMIASVLTGSLVVENIFTIGGLGAAVCEALEEECPVPVRRIGVQDVFGHSGPMLEVMKDFGLCADNIVKQTKDFL